MAAGRVLLDVVGDPRGGQRALQPSRRAAQGAIPAAEAADDRAGPGEQVRRVLGHRAVVDAGHVVAMVRGQQEGEAPAHAEADHADPAGAAWLADQPVPDRLHVLEDPPLPPPHVADRGPHAGQRAAPGEQVRHGSQVALAGQPVRLVAHVLAHAHGVVDDHHARPGRRARRRGQVHRQQVPVGTMVRGLCAASYTCTTLPFG